MALSVGELVAYLRLHTGTFDRDTAAVRGSLDLTGKSALKMGASVGKSEAALKGASQAAHSASASSGKLRAAQLSVVAAQERYNALMAAGTGNTARLASAEAALIRSQQRLAAIRPPTDPGGLARMRHNALGAIETIGKLGLSFGLFELAIKGVELVKSGNELTVALNAVQAASQGTDTQMAKAKATALALGKDLTVPKATAIDAAVAMDDLVRSGVSLDRAMVAARPALLLASAAQVDIADAARVTGDVMDDFRLKAEQAGHVANVLAAASTSAGGGLMDLFDGMKYAGPSARIVGIDVDTTAASLVLMAKAGHQGSIGGTAFANMLSRLSPVAKSQKEAMHDLGVEAWDAQGRFVGLPKVVEQLHQAMERMSPEQFQKAVQIAFGNRAKLAVYDFAHGGAAALDVFTKKMKAGDVQAYANTMNRGLTAAGAQLKKEFTAWAIDLNDKVTPALATAAFALGNGLPHAVALLQHTLQPLEQELTTVLVPAWHVTAAVLGLVGHGLGDVAGLLDRHRGTVQVVSTVVIGMWAAWKGYTIARTAVQAVSEALFMLRLRASVAKDAVTGVVQGTSSISAGALALGGLGIALGVAAYAWQKHSAAVAASREEVDGFTSAIKADSGALGENTKAAVFNALQKQGAINAAKQFHISLADLTDASLGNADALGRVNGALDEYKKFMDDTGASQDNVTSGADNGADAYWKLRDAVGGTSAKVKEAVTGYHDQQAALGKTATAAHKAEEAHKALATSLVYTVDASGNLVQAQQTVGGKVNDTTEELVKEKSAADLLKSALDALNGVALSQEQTTNAFLDSLDSLTESVKTNGHSLAQNSAAGRKNRETIVSIIEAAKAQAQATADTAAKTHDQTDALKIGNDQLKKNEDRIRAQAAKLHLSKEATDALIKSLGKLVTVKPVHIPVDASPVKTAVEELQQRIDGIKQGKPVVLGAKSDAGRAEVVELQARINAIAQGKVPGLDADSRAGRAEVADLQARVTAIKQGKPVRVDANSAGGRAKIAELQQHIDAIKQHRPTGLNADAAAARAKIVTLQGQINAIRQGRVPGLDADSSAGRRKIAALQAQIDALRGKTIPINFAINNNVGQAVHDAVNAIPTQTIPVRVAVSGGGNQPRANAAGTAGGGLPDGWFTMNEQGWELGRKQGSRVDIFSHEQSKKMLPQGPSVPAYASGTGRTKAKAKKAKKKAPKPVIDSIVQTAGHGAAWGIASYIKGEIPSVKSATKLLATAVNDAFHLKGIQAAIAKVKTDLASTIEARGQFTSGVASSLAGQVDITKYGDAAGMIAALQGGTGSNKRFTAEVKKLGAEHVPTALIQALSKDGPNAGLDTVANASKRDLAQIVKNYSGFSASAQRGGTVAGNIAYGPQIAADRRALASYAKQSARTETAMVNATLALARMVDRPVVIKIDGKAVVTTQMSNGQVKGVLDVLRKELVTGRRKP